MRRIVKSPNGLVSEDLNLFFKGSKARFNTIAHLASGNTWVSNADARNWLDRDMVLHQNRFGHVHNIDGRRELEEFQGLKFREAILGTLNAIGDYPDEKR